jgi:hypothetical protein
MTVASGTSRMVMAYATTANFSSASGEFGVADGFPYATVV